jgi:regulatory protein
MAMTRRPLRKHLLPLDDEALEQRALAYAGRYATTRARLADYLHRKIRERGWAGTAEPPVERLVDRMAALGYVDDRAFAAARATSLARRGYGARRVRDVLRAAGIADDDRADADAALLGSAWESALRFAERRRLGPFAAAEQDRAAREKAMAAMLRAGHSAELARRLVRAPPGEIPEPDGD